ncbi:MAG: glutamate 5-kinase [Desulfovibrionales bacterium]
MKTSSFSSISDENEREGRQSRRNALRDSKRTVIKIGSAVLTGPDGPDLRVMNRLADQISALHDKGMEVILVSSGAVAAGRKTIPCPGTDRNLPASQAFSAVGQSRLMHIYDEAFERYGKITAQVLLTRDDLKSRQRFLNARNTFASLLKWRVIPIVNENDTVAVQELKFGDNDALASQILNLVEADLFINLTSEEGVFDSNPQINPNANLLKSISNIDRIDLESLCSGKTKEGTGGMYSKLLSARRAAQLGVPTLILSGKIPFGLEKAFSGQILGTWIMAEKKAISRKKFWMAYQQDPAGAIVIDEGAARALVSGKKSLLPAGILDVQGKFGAGALIRIRDGQGNEIGVGLSNYRASELRRIKGRKSDEIKDVLGHCMYPEAIHRDNLLLDAAV